MVALETQKQLIISGFLSKDVQDIMENNKRIGRECGFYLLEAKGKIASKSVSIYDTLETFVGKPKVPFSIEIDMMFSDEPVKIDARDPAPSAVMARLQGKTGSGYLYLKRQRHKVQNQPDLQYDQHELIYLINNPRGDLMTNGKHSISEELNHNRGKFAVIVIRRV